MTWAAASIAMDAASPTQNGCPALTQLSTASCGGKQDLREQPEAQTVSTLVVAWRSQAGQRPIGQVLGR